MATTTDRLPISHKHYLKPTQNGRATWLDEVKFVEEMIENPLMLERYGLSPYGEYFTYKLLMCYAYTVLDLRGKDVADFMFNTMREVAIKYQQLKPSEFDENIIRNMFDGYNSYGKLVCYGGTTYKEDTYKDKVYYTQHLPLQVRMSRKVLNCWEFLMSVRPQVFTENIVFYKSEVDAILDLFGDDLHKILIAFHVVLRAKLFESSRCYWDNREIVDEVTGEVFKVNQNSDAKHWNTPFIREHDVAYVTTGVCDKRSRDLKHELGIEDRRGVANLYNEVIIDMQQAGLIEDISKIGKGNGGYSQVDGEVIKCDGYGITYTVKDFKDGKVAYKINRDAKTYLQATARKDLQGAYKPTFLKLHSDEEVAFELDYYALTHGYVFDMFVYLCSISHKSVRGVKCRIETCKQCGDRFLVYMDGTKGRTSSYCLKCSDGKARAKRCRSK